jgi:hypothetical protein
VNEAANSGHLDRPERVELNVPAPGRPDRDVLQALATAGWSPRGLDVVGGPGTARSMRRERLRARIAIAIRAALAALFLGRRAASLVTLALTVSTAALALSWFDAWYVQAAIVALLFALLRIEWGAFERSREAREPEDPGRSGP